MQDAEETVVHTQGRYQPVSLQHVSWLHTRTAVDACSTLSADNDVQPRILLNNDKTPSANRIAGHAGVNPSYQRIGSQMHTRITAVRKIDQHPSKNSFLPCSHKTSQNNLKLHIC